MPKKVALDLYHDTYSFLFNYLPEFRRANGHAVTSTLVVELTEDEYDKLKQLESLNDWFQKWAAKKDSNDG